MTNPATPTPTDLPEALRLATARAIWAVMREHEDRSDMELEDMGEHCHAWALADAALSAAAPAVAPAKWVYDPHDIEQGLMLNPEWLSMHGLTTSQASLLADPGAAPTTEQSSEVAQAGWTDAQYADYINDLRIRANEGDAEAGKRYDEYMSAKPPQAGAESYPPSDALLAGHTDLLTYVLQGDVHNRLTPRVIDIAYTAFMQARRPNAEDGGPSDWFNDTKPMIESAIEKLRSDLMEDRTAALRARGAVPSDARTDALYDSAYIAGAKAGYNFGVEEDAAGLGRIIEARSGYLAVLAAPAAPMSAQATSGWMPVPRAVYNALLAWHSPGGGDERDCAVLMDATSAMLAAAPQPPAALPGEQDAVQPASARDDKRCKACIDRRDGFYGSYAPACPVHDDDGNLRAAKDRVEGGRRA